jgi:hypothetical protein
MLSFCLSSVLPSSFLRPPSTFPLQSFYLLSDLSPSNFYDVSWIFLPPRTLSLPFLCAPLSYCIIPVFPSVTLYPLLQSCNVALLPFSPSLSCPLLLSPPFSLELTLG